MTTLTRAQAKALAEAMEELVCNDNPQPFRDYVALLTPEQKREVNEILDEATAFYHHVHGCAVCKADDDNFCHIGEELSGNLPNTTLQ